MARAKRGQSSEIISESLRKRIDAARSEAAETGKPFILRDLFNIRNPAEAFERGLKDAYLYTFHGSQKVSPEQMKTEYNRLRNIANKRINRLIEAGYGELPEVQYNIDRFGPLGRNPSERDIRRAFVDVASFVQSAGSLVSQQRFRDVSNALMLEEVTGDRAVTTADVRMFGNFMEFYRSKKYSKVIASEDVKDFYIKAKASGKTVRQIRKDFTQFSKAYREKAKRRV